MASAVSRSIPRCPDRDPASAQIDDSKAEELPRALDLRDRVEAGVAGNPEEETRFDELDIDGIRMPFGVPEDREPDGAFTLRVDDGHRTPSVGASALHLELHWIRSDEYLVAGGPPDARRTESHA